MCTEHCSFPASWLEEGAGGGEGRQDPAGAGCEGSQETGAQVTQGAGLELWTVHCIVYCSIVIHLCSLHCSIDIHCVRCCIVKLDSKLHSKVCTVQYSTEEAFGRRHFLFNQTFPHVMLRYLVIIQSLFYIVIIRSLFYIVIIRSLLITVILVKLQHWSSIVQWATLMVAISDPALFSKVINDHCIAVAMLINYHILVCSRDHTSYI